MEVSPVKLLEVTLRNKFLFNARFFLPRKKSFNLKQTKEWLHFLRMQMIQILQKVQMIQILQKDAGSKDQKINQIVRNIQIFWHPNISSSDFSHLNTYILLVQIVIVI